MALPLPTPSLRGGNPGNILPGQPFLRRLETQQVTQVDQIQWENCRLARRPRATWELSSPSSPPSSP